MTEEKIVYEIGEVIMNFQPYCEGNWRVDYKAITVNYPQGPWTIWSEQIEYFEEKAEWNGSTYIFEISIKAKGWDMPHTMGRFVHGASHIRDALATFAARNGLEYRNAESCTWMQSSSVKNTEFFKALQQERIKINQNGNYAWNQLGKQIYNAPKKKNLLKIFCISVSIIIAVFIILFLFPTGHVSKKPVYEKKLAPSVESQTVSYKNVKIIIPGGMLNKDETLVISTVKNVPEPLKGLIPLSDVYDIKLGDLEKFDQPIIVEYAYDEKYFYKEFSIGEQFLPLYYNENTKLWEDLPFEVDENRKVLQLQMYHLSTIRPYYSYYEGAYVYATNHFYIMFDPKDPVYRLSSMKYQKYVLSKDVSRLNEELPGKLSYYIEDIGKIADEAYEGYKTMGFTMPSSKFKIYLAEKCLYNSITGNITIDQRAGSENKPEEKLKTYIGHELFHGAQNYTIGNWKYSNTNGNSMSFWMEATAEYMGDIGLWTKLGKSRTDEMQRLDENYFSQSFTTFNGTHEYQSSQFVKYLQTKYPDIGMLDYIKAVRGIDNFEVYLNEFLRNAKKTTFMDEFTEFAVDMLFNPSSECDISSNKVILEKIVKKQFDVKFELNSKGIPRKSEVELKIPVKIEKPYTAVLYAVKFDAPANVAVPSASSDSLINISAATIMPTATGRGMKQIVKPFTGGTEREISVSKDEILIIIATGSRSGENNLVIKAQCQAELKAEGVNSGLVGLWDVSTLQMTDIKANDVYWKDYSDATLGKGKNDEIKAWNDTLSRSTYYIFIVESDDATGSYILKMGTSKAIGRSEGILPIPIVIEGDHIKAEGFNMRSSAKEYLEFDLKLENGKLTGTYSSTVNADGNAPTTKYGNVTRICRIEAVMDDYSKAVLEDYQKSK